MTKKDAIMEHPSLSNTGALLSLIASGAARSRPALLGASGLSRVTVTQRVNALLASGLIRETSRTLPSGGRPTRVLGINEKIAFILVADIGENHIRLAALDLSPAILMQRTISFSVSDGVINTLQRIASEFDALAERMRSTHGFLLAVGLSLPAPVDFERGSVVGPSVLHGWDDFDIVAWMSKRYDAPIFIENDVNLMTIFEHRHNFPQVDNMVFIKAGTGVGSGIIAGGRIFRGTHGLAGDIGHIQFNPDDAPLCRCGKFGCVEAWAGGWAIARDLADKGFPARNARDVISLVETQKPEAIMLLRNAGRIIGEVASNLVSILNPALVVVGGTLARGGDLLLSGIRELVYQRCLPLATRELQIVPAAPHGEKSVLLGMAHLVLDDIFCSPKAEKLLERVIEGNAAGK